MPVGGLLTNIALLPVESQERYESAVLLHTSFGTRQWLAQLQSDETSSVIHEAREDCQKDCGMS